MKIFFKKGKIGKPAFSASTKNAMSQIKSRVKAPVTALVHLHPALQLWLQCMESGEWWGRGRGQGAGQQEVYLSDKHQQGTIREYSVWLALPHLQSSRIPSLNPVTDMQLTNIKEGGFSTE